MQEVINQLSALVNEHADKLKKFSEQEFSAKPDPAKWSKKEIVGHLIDSAQNNIRRFIVGQYEDKPHIIYHQDEWVAMQDYRHYSTAELIQLWQLLNRHICIILKNMPVENYQRVCNTSQEKESFYTLAYLATDYVRHHEHHLKQIFPDQ